MIFDNSFSQVLWSAPWFVLLIAALLLITLIVNLVKGIRQWTYNNAQPVQTIAAKLIAKRMEVTGGNFNLGKRMEDDKTLFRYAQTARYYAAFELADGKSVELRVKHKEYDLLSENAVGQLTLQGTRYCGFKHGLSHSDLGSKR